MKNSNKKRLNNLILFICLFCFASCLTGCNDDDSELVLITTEKSEYEDIVLPDSGDGTATAVEEPVTTETVSTEEASDAEKSITLEDLYYANRGDVLLSGGSGCSINTIYYSGGTEIYSEYSYLGFDESGNYIQAYEDSDGNLEILDGANQYWYVYEEGRIYTKIYPEEGAAGAMINYNHNELIVTAPSAESGEVISDVYRQEGKLVIETSYTNSLDEVYTYKYFVDDALLVQEIYCYDEYGEQISYAWVTKDAVYNMPEEIINIKSSGTTRIVTLKYPDGSGFETLYEVSDTTPIKLEMYSSTAYIDESCATPWMGAQVGGAFSDETIYIKLNQ